MWIGSSTAWYSLILDLRLLSIQTLFHFNWRVSWRTGARGIPSKIKVDMNRFPFWESKAVLRKGVGVIEVYIDHTDQSRQVHCSQALEPMRQRDIPTRDVDIKCKLRNVFGVALEEGSAKCAPCEL